MARDYETEPSEEAEGGPVKSFLEHLEDFRWVLIKSLVALGLAMFVCLMGANYVVEILKWPITHNIVRSLAQRYNWTVPSGPQPVIWKTRPDCHRQFRNKSSRQVFKFLPEEREAFNLGSNHFVNRFRFEPVDGRHGSWHWDGSAVARKPMPWPLPRDNSST